ncbi:GNAT family N-acetyltransferase [Virgibacillus dokdonensis]|uniref:GNAT family N-acetyltransferase n=1 Tax=Virgibacillus dokdonensis TaxID=302167 RepID=UPI00098A19D3|nr:GNAT family N-acetyltransferase [Virgibacillus dokdonensis]
MYTIKKGFEESNRQRAAKLYSEAFERKFSKVVGNREVIEGLLEQCMDSQFCFGAYNENNQLVGLMGFHIDNQALIKLKISSFIKTFGAIRGIYKASLLQLLFNHKSDNAKQLLMNGVAIESTYRGRGIGSQLFEALFTFVKSEGYESIKLHVIDENPRAKALYERLGLVQKKHEKMPRWAADLFGVSGFSAMVLPIREKEKK